MPKSHPRVGGPSVVTHPTGFVHMGRVILRSYSTELTSIVIIVLFSSLLPVIRCSGSFDQACHACVAGPSRSSAFYPSAESSDAFSPPVDTLVSSRLPTLQSS